MLLMLTQWLAQDIRAFNVFGYITLRAVLGTLTALTISFVVGPGMIRKLTVYKIGQAVRDDGPQTHLKKAGTPTMGGALILVSITIATLLWSDLATQKNLLYGRVAVFGSSAIEIHCLLNLEGQNVRHSSVSEVERLECRTSHPASVISAKVCVDCAPLLQLWRIRPGGGAIYLCVGALWGAIHTLPVKWE